MKMSLAHVHKQTQRNLLCVCMHAQARLEEENRQQMLKKRQQQASNLLTLHQHSLVTPVHVHAHIPDKTKKIIQD
jgi:hypothetical protein